MDPQIIRESLQQFLEERQPNLEHFAKLQRQQVVVQHFSDELLDGFAPHSRMKIYPALLIAYQEEAVPLLKHRMGVETSEAFKRVMRKMIEVFDH